ncbi:MAG: DUF1987 domain-containing protein [Opitutae bacterium]|nr:DUF1987 domain-containing protein [Opitutae bacterium]
MENLNLARSKSTPEVAFDAAAGIMAMTGESYPENSFEYYRPLLVWLQQYLPTASVPLTFNFNLSYLNTGSTKSVMDILDLLEDAYEGGKVVQVNWYYDAENDRALSNAEEFREEVRVPFRILPLSGR